MSDQPAPLKEYWSDDIVVTFDRDRCIHVAECLRGLPQVFDTRKRPWVQPANASADEVAAVVMRCPSGALHFQRKDGGPAEPVPERNTVRLRVRGPLQLQGDVELRLDDGTVIHDTRVTLCRCGASRTKPFCDNSHLHSGFQAGGDLGQNKVRTVEGLELEGRLVVTPTADGPIKVEGDFEIVSARGDTAYQGNRAFLCRCGGSENKPFCDGTHARTGFQAEGA